MLDLVPMAVRSRCFKNIRKATIRGIDALTCISLLCSPLPCLFAASPEHLSIVAMATGATPEPNDIDYLIAVPTFIGSLLSFLGSATAIAFQIARPPQRHFRHSLIINLLTAGK